MSILQQVTSSAELINQYMQINMKLHATSLCLSCIHVYILNCYQGCCFRDILRIRKLRKTFNILLANLRSLSCYWIRRLLVCVTGL